MTSRKLLCTATLLCLAPFAASAAEAYLSPNTNGGSGALPSGYTKLFFDMANGDWTHEVTLPATPRDGDAVILSSMAANSSRLKAEGAAFADLAYLPVQAGSEFRLVWNGADKRWDAGTGVSSRQLVGKNVAADRIPGSSHTLTQMVLRDGFHVGTISLPQLAPYGAVVVVSNRATWGTTIDGAQLAGGASQVCHSHNECGYVYNADGKWHARRGRAHMQPPTQPQLPTLATRWTDLVLNGPAEDITTPQRLMLPTDGIEGDILQASDRSNSGYYRLSGHSLGSEPVTFRYNAQRRSWVKQPQR